MAPGAAEDHIGMFLELRPGGMMDRSEADMLCLYRAGDLHPHAISHFGIPCLIFYVDSPLILRP